MFEQAAAAPRAPGRALLLIAGAAIAAGVGGLFIGAFPLRPSDVVGALFGGDAEARLVLGMRLPRLVLAAEIGAALGVAGAVMQGVLRNDLAAPGLLGVQAGGQAGVLLALALLPGMLPPLALPAASIVGAGLAFGLVLLLSTRRGVLEPHRVLLVGLAVTLAIGSVTSVLSLILPMGHFDFFQAWLSGSLERAEPLLLWVLAPWVLVLVPLVWGRAHTLDALCLEASSSIALGVRLQRERLLLLMAATGLAGACAAVDGGSIAFCGLLAPHIARRLVGPLHRRLVPAAAGVGVALVLLADALGRSLPDHELPAGALVTLLGGPYFLWLLTRR